MIRTRIMTRIKITIKIRITTIKIMIRINNTTKTTITTINRTMTMEMQIILINSIIKIIKRSKRMVLIDSIKFRYFKFI